MNTIKSELKKLKARHSTTVHGIEWAEIYIANDDSVVVRYKQGKHIKLSSRPDYYKEFDNGFDRYQVDLRTLNLKGGPALEAEKAESLLNGKAKNKPFIYGEI